MEAQELNKEEMTVGELVAQDYRKAEVFKKFGIDFCCGGKAPLNEVCRKKDIDIAQVNEALTELDEKPAQLTQDYNNWDLDFLIDYIVNTHHKYVNEALPLLDEFSAKVAQVHGETHPEVIEIAHHYNMIADELRMHMHKEEVVLFPYVKEMLDAQRNNDQLSPSPFGTIKNPIHMMEMEHDSAGGSFKVINELSNGFTPPEEACNTYRVLYFKLKEFEENLHEHIHLENNILFPRAIKLEEALLS